jgi:hypothetical protein
MDKLSKVEAKLLKAQQKEFKRKFNKVRSKIRRLKDIKKEDKKVLIADLSNVNGDLINVLFYCKQFTSVSDYFDTINAYLRSEKDCYNYDVPGYVPSKMLEIMNIIREYHNTKDRYNSLKSKILGKNAI